MECYLDNSATTAVSPAAAALALRMMTEEFGNPSSLHRRGFLAERALTEARGQVAAVLHCRPDEIIFTSGGTESNNIALLGAAHALRRRGNRIVTTAVEHHSILAIGKALEAEGFEVITVSPDESGHITPEAMAAACNEKTILVSCMMVNSETGALHNIPAIAAACRRKNPNIVFHSDCVQAFCRLPIEPAKWGVQLVSVSGHKIHAPKGIGALYVAKGTRLLPAIYGSGQEKGLRPGTENVPGPFCRPAPANDYKFISIPGHLHQFPRRCGTLYRQLFGAGHSQRGYDSLSGAVRHLCLQRFCLCQGGTQPCAHRHGARQRSH